MKFKILTHILTYAFIALTSCPELDIASQGKNVEKASSNLKEAVALFFSHASTSEITRRLHEEVFVTRVEIPVG